MVDAIFFEGVLGFTFFVSHSSKATLGSSSTRAFSLKAWLYFFGQTNNTLIRNWNENEVYFAMRTNKP